MAKLETGAAESVGDDDVSSGVNVGAMYRCDHLRHGKIELFRRLAGLETALLKHGAHGAIQDKHPLPYGITKWFHGCPFIGFDLPGTAVLADGRGGGSSSA